MASLNSDVAANPPRAIHAGLNVVDFVYSLGAALSAGDVIHLCKVPRGAKLVDFLVNALRTGAGNTWAYQLSLQSAGDVLGTLSASTTLAGGLLYRAGSPSTIANPGNTVPVLCSLSDGDPNGFRTLKLTVTASVSLPGASGSITGFAAWVMP